MHRVLLLGGLAVLALTATVAEPAAAHGNEGNGRRGSSRYYGGFYSRADREHDRHHNRLDRRHDRAHRRGFDSRWDHERWHRKAGKHHDGDHHRIYGEHAPNRRYYYGDRRDDFRYSRHRSHRHRH